jgi:two-component system chemotaxis response regulator CheB
MFPFEVIEAQEGDTVQQGRVLLAPGGYHMELLRRGRSFYVTLNQEPMLHGVRPSADYLMKSVARLCGPNAMGLILTGMGRDGADGLLAMHRAGSYNVAQDEATCIVFGMPKSAIEQGAVDAVLPLQEVASHIQKRLRKRQAS